MSAHAQPVLISPRNARQKARSISCGPQATEYARLTKPFAKQSAVHYTSDEIQVRKEQKLNDQQGIAIKKSLSDQELKALTSGIPKHSKCTELFYVLSR